MVEKSSDNSETSISAAITILHSEKSQVSDEKTAFERFGTQIEDISPDLATSTADMIGCERESSSKTLLKVREAYIETVMDVSHYDDEYNDTYRESIHAEFGPDIALLLTQSNQLTPAIKSTLFSAIDEAIEQRKELEEVVERELGSVQSAATEVSSINNRVRSLSETDFHSATYEALDGYKDQTEELTVRCDDIAKNRQHDLASIERSWHSSTTSPDLPTYLYESLSVTYPVLARIGQVGDMIKNLRQEIKQAIVY